MLYIASLPPPDEIVFDGPSTYLPVIQVVLAAIALLAVVWYAVRSAQIAPRAERHSEQVTRRAEDCAALGVTSVWSLGGPWM